MEKHKFIRLGKSNPNMSLRWAGIARLERVGEGQSKEPGHEGVFAGSLTLWGISERELRGLRLRWERLN